MPLAGFIILSRLDSKRLPGKALRRVAGRELLDYVIQRVRYANCGHDRPIILATTDRELDDPLADFARNKGLEVYRGAVDDVAGRVINCADNFGLDYFVRVNADSPFLDPILIDQAIHMAIRESYDLVTNLVPRSFPYGVSVEVVRTAAFRKAYELMTSPEHHEHVTKFLYEHLERFHYINIPCPYGNQSHYRLTVDTPEDLEKFEAFLNQIQSSADLISYSEAMHYF